MYRATDDPLPHQKCSTVYTVDQWMSTTYLLPKYILSIAVAMVPYLYPYLQHFSVVHEIILTYWEKSVGVANYICVHVCVHSPH